MLHPRLTPLLALLLTPGIAGAEQQRPPAPAGPSMRVRELVIQQRMIIRVPKMRPQRSTAPAGVLLPPIEWQEKKADKCIPTTSVAAAAITRGDSVDLVLNGGKRLRARLESSCPSLDFYSGFYMKLNGDGKLCARRDSIRSRSGGECQIKSFRTLVPKR